MNNTEAVKEMRLHLSYHEAGHAAAALHVGISVLGISMELDWKTGTLGCVYADFTPLLNQNGRHTREGIEKRIIVLIAGAMAEGLLTNKPNRELADGCRWDTEEKWNLAELLHPGDEAAQKATLTRLHTDTHALLTARWGFVATLADELARSKFLSASHCYHLWNEQCVK